jgi:CO/xanthine dehydrogenase FAD-binding subunit
MPNVLQAGEILTGIVLPPASSDIQSTFIKVSDRKGLDFATGSIAASNRSETGGKSEVSIIVGSLTSAPVQLERTEHIIRESGLTDTAIESASTVAKSELGPLTNLFTSAGHKRTLVTVLVKKALMRLKAQLAS